MRILQVVTRPQRRGAELFAQQLSAELRRRDHDLRTLYLYREAPAPRLELAPNDMILGARSQSFAERAPGAQLGILRGLLAQVDRQGTQIVQANGSRAVKYVALATALRPRRSWRAVYRNIGNPADWSRGVRRSLFRRLVLPRFDGIVSVSEASLEQVRRVYRPRVPAVHIPRGIDPASLVPTSDRASVRDELATPPQAPVVVTVGSLSPEKRLDRLLVAIAVLSQELPEIHAWILGDGAQRASLEEHAAALGVASRVRFLGLRRDVGTFLAAADLFVLTSDTEGMPGVVLEAGSCGLAAVATNVGGTGECLVDGETGILVTAGDDRALVTAIRRLVVDASTRHRLGEAARARVASLYSIESVARRYEGFYTQLLA